MVSDQAVRELTVDDVFDPDEPLAVIVDDATPLRDVLANLDAREDLNAVLVVDTRERLLGAITRADLAAWMSTALDTSPVADAFPWGELIEALKKASAEDACNPRSGELAVEPTEPLEHALRNMLMGQLATLPVVDPDGRVLGELELGRVLSAVADAAGASGSRW